MTVSIYFRKLHPEAQLPRRGTPGSIGLDIYAHLLTEDGRPNNVMIPSCATRPIPTGLAFDPKSIDPLEPWTAFICSRSGMAGNSVFVANAPGIIDPDYTGELCVLLFNGSHQTFYVRHGDRIAQLVLVKTIFAETIESQSEKPTIVTKRGAKGFGSTGR